MSDIILEQSSVIAFITKVTRNLVYYKNGPRKTYNAYLLAIKTSPFYKKNNLYRRLKPYIEGSKNLDQLKNEDFIKKESKVNFSYEKDSSLNEAEFIEKKMLYVECKGDRGIFENTYGFEPKFH